MKRILYLFALMTAIMLTGSPQSHAQTVAVSGYVTDSVTGTPLEGANIYIGKDKFGETADSKGYFKFSVQKGRSVSFSVSFVGYDTRTVSLTATEDTILRIALAQDNRLPDIKVYASRRDFGAKSSQMSAIDVPIDQVKALPAVFGEVDVMKALQKLPGVQPALKDLYDKPEAMRPYTDMNYYDISAKITHRFSDRDKISAVFYWGKDVNDNAPSSNKGKYDGNKQIQDENGAFHILKVYYNKSRSTSTDNNWGNLVSSLFWTHSFNERFSVTQT